MFVKETVKILHVLHSSHMPHTRQLDTVKQNLSVIISYIAIIL